MACSNFVYGYFTIAVSAASLNALGIYFLVKDANRQTNQNLILKFLSAVELAYSCVMMIYWSFTCHGSMLTAVNVSSHIAHCIYINITLIMLTMTFDRLIATRYPLRYAVSLTKKRAKVILLSSVLICAIFILLFMLIEFDVINIPIDKFVSPVTSTFAACFMVTTYLYILMKISKRRRVGNSLQNARITRTTENQKFFKMSTIITLTYFTCCLLPDFAYMLCRGCFTNSTLVIRTLWHLGPLCDPITYIFMQKRLRKRLIEMMICCRKQDRKNDSRMGTVTSRRGALISRRGEVIPRFTENQRMVFDTKLLSDKDDSQGGQVISQVTENQTAVFDTKL